MGWLKPDSEMECHACADLQVVLMIVHAVVEMSEVVIQLPTKRKTVSQCVVHSAAELCGKGVGTGVDSCEGNASVSAAQKHVGEWRELCVVVPVIARAEEIGGQREVGS